MVTNEFDQSNLVPGPDPAASAAFDVKYEDGYFKITPGPDILHLVSGNFYARPLLPIGEIKTAMIAPVHNSFSAGSGGQSPITFTQDDRNRMIHIEQQLEQIKQLLTRK